VNPQTIARVTGVLFVITYLTSIPPFILLYPPVVGDPRYIVGAGPDTNAVLGAFLELLLIIANLGTTLVPFSIFKRVNESLALGYVTARVMESVFIAVGILCILTIVTLRQEAAGAAGADAGSLLAVGAALVAMHAWTFALGPGFVVGIGNGLILGYLMYRSGLVPRPLAVLGLVAGPVLCAYTTGVMFGVFEAGSVWQVIGTLPEFVWELSLGIYLIVKGFRPSALIAMDAAPAPAGA
jgi:branched-subunit amino acid transport protein AzlD